MVDDARVSSAYTVMLFLSLPLCSSHRSRRLSPTYRPNPREKGGTANLGSAASRMLRQAFRVPAFPICLASLLLILVYAFPSGSLVLFLKSDLQVVHVKYLSGCRRGQVGRGFHVLVSE
ncbi:hypothetical protein GE21DRAFT_1078610 [Neurospora crassa]|nr:hypothetical protein GE21DRAFT_1078610 [Neurospora crassa]